MNLACGLPCGSECGHLCSPCVGRSLGEGALSLFASQISPLSDRVCSRGSSKRMATKAATPAATQLRFRQQQRLRQELQSQGATSPRTSLPQLPPLSRQAESTHNDESQGGPCDVTTDESRVSMSPHHPTAVPKTSPADPLGPCDAAGSSCPALLSDNLTGKTIIYSKLFLSHTVNAAIREVATAAVDGTSLMFARSYQELCVCHVCPPFPVAYTVYWSSSAPPPPGILIGCSHEVPLHMCAWDHHINLRRAAPVEAVTWSCVCHDVVFRLSTACPFEMMHSVTAFHRILRLGACPNAHLQKCLPR